VRMRNAMDGKDIELPPGFEGLQVTDSTKRQSLKKRQERRTEVHGAQAVRRCSIRAGGLRSAVHDEDWWCA